MDRRNWVEKWERRSYSSQPPCDRRNQNHQFLMASQRKKQISSAASSLPLPPVLCNKSFMACLAKKIQGCLKLKERHINCWKHIFCTQNILADLLLNPSIPDSNKKFLEVSKWLLPIQNVRKIYNDGHYLCNMGVRVGCLILHISKFGCQN